MANTIAIIGAGRVGRALGRALRKRGWRIGAVVTRKRASALAAIRAIGAGKPSAGRWDELFAADVILIALPDRTIAGVAQRLAVESARWGRLQPAPRSMKTKARSLKAAPLQAKIIVHTSGSLSHDVLQPLRKHGAEIGAMHPMQTFGLGAHTRLAGVVFGLDGDARAVRVARRMVRDLGGIPVRVNPKRKAVYHLSGGFAAQHLLAVLEAGIRILMDAGLTRKQATQALLSMAQQTMDNLQRLGPQLSWTGPVPRGDYGTVRKHIAALRRLPPEYRQAYITLTRLAARMLARRPRKMLRDLDRYLKKA